MLKRSPKSRIINFAIYLIVIVAVFIGADSLLTFRTLANSYGTRDTYLIAKSRIASGSPIKKSELAKKEMFSSDAPQGALKANSIKTTFFAKETIIAETMITKEMVSTSAIDTVNRNNRIMFVPSKDNLNSSIGTLADLISVSPDGYGSEIIAHEAKILFDIDNLELDENLENPSPGYFVEITSQEAQDLTFALASGEVYFAILRNE